MVQKPERRSRAYLDCDGIGTFTYTLYVGCTNLGIVIASYRNKETENLANGIRVRKYEVIARIAQRKLLALQIANVLEDLFAPPGNRLEALKGDREGQHSIRINDQYRVCFTWKEGKAHDVEIVDYHS